jgi:biotin operon repressor
MPSWSSLSDGERDQILARRESGESIEFLAVELGVNENTLRGRLSEHRRYRGPDIIEDRPIPKHPELFAILKKGPTPLSRLSRMFDRSEATILHWIDEMRDAGYIIEENNQVLQSTKLPPKVDYRPQQTLADEMGQEIIFGVLSDPHAGSSHSQPSAMQRFVDIATNEYGVQHMLMPGDLTCGLYGYRGQEYDMIPAVRPLGRMQAAVATRNQIWLADKYLPQVPGLKYYLIGGNHDYWHIVNAGIDSVALFAESRDDSLFLGYDVADIPLTDRASVRMWHPTGGVPYALSYRLQKGLETLAFEELYRAIEENEDPKVRILIAGHLHVEVKFHRGPMVAALAGAFEGQTNYLKRKALYPTIGGQIWRIRLTDNGLVQRVEYTFIPFTEIEDDWKNFPVPDQGEIMGEPSRVEPLFNLAFENA